MQNGAVRHKIALLDDYQNVALQMADWSALRDRADIHAFNHHLGGEAEAVAALRDFDILCPMRERMSLPRRLLAQLGALKLIAVTGPYAHNLDHVAAKDLGIAVVATEGNVGNEGHTTPELAWGLILAAARHIAQESAGIRAGGWQNGMGIMLHGRTLGILGLGNIGTIMARYAAAFGMKVIAWSPNLTAERAAAGGARLVSKADLFRLSDVVSISLKPAPSTRGIVGRHEIWLMKPSAILVNTARGMLVDEPALVEALQNGRIAGAGLDVYAEEPLPLDHPLRTLDNVVLTPHIGYVTEEHYRLFYGQSAENIRAFIDGAPIRTVDGDGMLDKATLPRRR